MGIKRKHILFITYAIFAQYLNAQILSPVVVSSGGDFVETQEVIYSYTIGESFTSVFTLNENDLNVAIGFQQPWDIIVTSKNVLDNGFIVKAYPNPAYEIINVSVECTRDDKQQNIKLSIHNVIGEIVSKFSSSTWIDNKCFFQINLSHLPEGAYLIKVYEGNRVLEIKRILKLSIFE